MDIETIDPLKYEYSRQLEHIYQPPGRLFIRGRLPEKRLKSVAIVGARKPTAYGREVAQNLASALARHGVVVISGLAYGIDSEAHKSCLDAGGTTIAVLAGGLDKIYPASHKGLAEKIINNGGAILSEYEIGSAPQKFTFLERNRIVSGLADAVVVVEAAARSGTLSTANHALDQGKEVFAVPGNITSPLSEGCNKLLKMGATPLLSAQDVLDFLFPDGVEDKQALLFLAENKVEETILQIIQSGERDGDAIIKKSALSAQEFSQVITMLEIKGAVKSLGGNKWGLS